MEIQQFETSNKGIKDIILRLGGLLADLSFFGAKGQLIWKNWIIRVSKAIYADTTVGHKLTDNAISQAICKHTLIEAVLYVIILSKIYKVPLPFKEKKETEKTDQRKGF